MTPPDLRATEVGGSTNLLSGAAVVRAIFLSLEGAELPVHRLRKKGRYREIDLVWAGTRERV